MSEAIVINNAYKHFGAASQPLWKRMAAANGLPQTAAAGVKIPQASVAAVNNISFSVREGEIFGLFGPAGSGKSTLLRLIATLLLPDDGSISVLGHDVVRHAVQVQRLLNRVSVEASFFTKFSALENLLYSARLAGQADGQVRPRIAGTLLRLGLSEPSIHAPINEIGGPERQKVAIARAIISRPRVLLMDESTRGLDLQDQRAVHALLFELNRQFGTTILFSTRDLAEASAVCERIAVLDKGKVIALGGPSSLLQRLNRNEAITDPDNAILQHALEAA